ncbi:hypothetical protein TNCV_2844471, partial [Trichonephila clavipes]
TATAGSDVVQSGRPIFDDFFQHLWSAYIGNNARRMLSSRKWSSVCGCNVTSYSDIESGHGIFVGPDIPTRASCSCSAALLTPRNLTPSTGR